MQCILLLLLFCCCCRHYCYYHYSQISMYALPYLLKINDKWWNNFTKVMVGVARPFFNIIIGL